MNKTTTKQIALEGFKYIDVNPSIYQKVSDDLNHFTDCIFFNKKTKGHAITFEFAVAWREWIFLCNKCWKAKIYFIKEKKGGIL